MEAFEINIPIEEFFAKDRGSVYLDQDSSEPNINPAPAFFPTFSNASKSPYSFSGFLNKIVGNEKGNCGKGRVELVGALDFSGSLLVDMMDRDTNA